MANTKPSEISEATKSAFKNKLDIAVSNSVSSVTFTSTVGTWVGSPSAPITSNSITLDTTGAVNGGVAAIYYKGNVLDKYSFIGGTVEIMTGVNLSDDLCIVWVIYDSSANKFIVNIQKDEYVDVTTTTTTTIAVTTTTTTGIPASTTTTTTLFPPSTTTTTTSAISLLTNLIALYELDETVGTTVTDETGSYNGVSSDVILNQTSVTNITPAYGFNGTNSYININETSAFNFERTDSFSISFWIYGNDALNKVVAGNQDGVGGVFAGWQISWEGKITVILRSDQLTNNRILVSTPAMSTATWYHVVITYDGSSTAAGVSVYLNGADQTLTVGTDNLTSSMLTGNQIYIGARDNLGLKDFLNADIDQIGIWNRELTLTDAQTLYNSGNGLVHSNW